MCNPTINVTAVSNWPITRHGLVSNNTRLHAKNINAQPTNGINFVIIDTDELVRALVSGSSFYPEEEGGDHSAVCTGPAPCVSDSCMLMMWLGGAGGDTRLRSVFVSLSQGNPLCNPPGL